jgi:hypothetical protein
LKIRKGSERKKVDGIYTEKSLGEQKEREREEVQ